MSSVGPSASVAASRERGVERGLVEVAQHDGGRLLGDGPLGEQPAHAHRGTGDDHSLARDRLHDASLALAPASPDIAACAASAAERTRSKSSSVYAPSTPEIVASFMPCLRPRR